MFLRRRSLHNGGCPNAGWLFGAVFVLMLPFQHTAVADNPDRSDVARGVAKLGTFHIGGDSETLRPTTPPLAKNLLRLFADARAANEKGDDARAQRLYERVIAAQPDSILADEARRDLAEIYQRAGVRRSEHAVDTGPNLSGPQIRKHHADNLTKDTGRSAPADAQRSRSVVMLERQFIADVGDRIFFAKGSARLGARANDVLAAQAAWLRTHPDIVVSIEGHADDGAAPDRDQYELALARAEAVRRRLIEIGVSESRLTSVSFGRERPIANCSSLTCAPQNRRVVNVISEGRIQTADDSVDQLGNSDAGRVGR